MSILIKIIVATFFILGVGNLERCLSEERLMVFAGAASKPPTEEAAKVFEQKFGTKVDVVFGGSGYVLSQMILGKKGDVYFPGSSDYMEVAKKKEVVFPETEKISYILCLLSTCRRAIRKGSRHLKT